MDPARLTGYARERIGVRIRILRLLPAAGPRLLALAIALQLVAGLVPVGFIVATSAVVGRVPDAVEGGLDSPAWDSLRNALLVASVLFLLLHVSLAVQWTVSRAIEWAVDETVRERVVAASFAPAGVAALEDEQTLDELGDIVDPLRSIGFSPGGACAGMLSLLARYLQWGLASALVGIVYAWWAGLATAIGTLAIRLGIRSGLGRLAAFEASYAPMRRRRDYYARLLHGAGPAKEIRLFGLLPWLQERYRTQALDAVRPVWRARRRIVYLPYLASLPLSVVLTGLASIGVARAAAGERRGG